MIYANFNFFRGLFTWNFGDKKTESNCLNQIFKSDDFRSLDKEEYKNKTVSFKASLEPISQSNKSCALSKQQIKALTAFQYASEDELELIRQAADSSEIPAIQNFIIKGEWKELVEWLQIDSDNRRYIMFAAHAVGVITSLELYTALMFADTISAQIGRTWSIEESNHPVDLKSPILRIFDTRKDPSLAFLYQVKPIFKDLFNYELGSFEGTDESSVVNLPSLMLLQKLLQSQEKSKDIEVCPIMHLSPIRKAFTQRLCQKKHDIAFFPPHSSELIHGLPVTGLTPPAHDILHILQRISLPNLDKKLELARAIECIQETLPPYEKPFILSKHLDLPWFPLTYKNELEEDLRNWLLETTICRILDGFDCEETTGPIHSEEFLRGILSEAFDVGTVNMHRFDEEIDLKNIIKGVRNREKEIVDGCILLIQDHFTTKTTIDQIQK